MPAAGEGGRAKRRHAVRSCEMSERRVCCEQVIAAAMPSPNESRCQRPPPNASMQRTPCLPHAHEVRLRQPHGAVVGSRVWGHVPPQTNGAPPAILHRPSNDATPVQAVHVAFRLFTAILPPRRLRPRPPKTSPFQVVRVHGVAGQAERTVRLQRYRQREIMLIEEKRRSKTQQPA